MNSTEPIAPAWTERVRMPGTPRIRPAMTNSRPHPDGGTRDAGAGGP